MRPVNVKILLTLAAILIGVVVTGFVLYNILVFRVTSTTPSPQKFPTITPYIDIYFSKPIDNISTYTLNDEETGSISIHDKRLRFTPSSIFSDKTKYILKISGIRSKSGDRIDYSYSFTARYMNYNDVPQDIQKASVEKSSSGQIDDPFFNNYFPMQTEDFQIEHPYDKTSTDNQKILHVTFMKEVYNYDTNTRTKLSDEEANRLHDKVIKYIESRGGKPANYQIYYSNEYLNIKYPQQDSED